MCANQADANRQHNHADDAGDVDADLGFGPAGCRAISSSRLPICATIVTRQCLHHLAVVNVTDVHLPSGLPGAEQQDEPDRDGREANQRGPAGQPGR
jgi:hypothetical protein